MERKKDRSELTEFSDEHIKLVFEDLEEKSELILRSMFTDKPLPKEELDKIYNNYRKK